MQDIVYIPRPLISQPERQLLEAPHQLDVCNFHYRKIEYVFSVRLTLARLLPLLDAAPESVGLYELQSIRRVGDLLHYIDANWSSSSQTVKDMLAERAEALRRHTWQHRSDTSEQLPLLQFQRLFSDDPDESHPLDNLWRGAQHHATNNPWLPWLYGVLELIQVAQQRLAASHDPLVSAQLRLIHAGRHPSDTLPYISRGQMVPVQTRDSMPDALIQRLVELIENLEIRAVASGKGDIRWWQVLYRLQLKRMHDTGKPAQEALQLSASSSGTPLEPANWGGDIHISYEGMQILELTVLPDWRRFDSETFLETGSLRDGLTKGFPPGPECRVLVTQSDLGLLPGLEREQYSDWFIYSQAQRTSSH